MSFSDLGLSEKVLEAVTAAGYTSPTPIQAQAIPHALARRDVLGIAQTGTGKTAAFTLPMLNLLETGRARARMPRTLILEPTRELAAQVEESFVKLGASHKLSVALLIGGVSFAEQDAKITRGADVLIATPGRLLDHFERGKLLLTGIEVLVIDEADRMLDMGFIPDIERICKMVPFTRQTLFFSATMPPEIQRLTETFLHNPVKIEVARPSSTASTITQRLVASSTESYEKREILRGLIRSAQDLQNAIIFCNRKRDVAILHRSLEKHGFSVVALHGDMDQTSRMQALDKFRNGGASLLVASDVAARGLDIPEVSHVYNFDVPFHAEDYVHRIGRTGRAGRSGYAASIVTSQDAKTLAAIEALTGKPIEWAGKTLDELKAERPDLDQPAARRERGRGPSRHQGGETRERRGAHHVRHTPHGEVAPMQPITREAPRPVHTPQYAPHPHATEQPRMHHHHPRQQREAFQPVRVGERHVPSRYRRDDDDLPVVGFGDHIPAFLLQKVKLSALTSDNDFVADENELEIIEDIDDEDIEHIEVQGASARDVQPQDAEKRATETRDPESRDSNETRKSGRRRRSRNKSRTIEIRTADQLQPEQTLPEQHEVTAEQPATVQVAAVETPVAVSMEVAEPKAKKPARRTTKKASVEAETAPAVEAAPDAEKPVRARRKAPAKKAAAETTTADAEVAAPAKKPTRARKTAVAGTEGEEKPVKKASPRKKAVTADAVTDDSAVKKPAARKPRKKATADVAAVDSPSADALHTEA